MKSSYGVKLSLINELPLLPLNHKLAVMIIGIISAMDSEHRQLAERLQEKKTSGDGSFRYVEGVLGGNRVILTQ